jgi:hypothetical protein
MPESGRAECGECLEDDLVALRLVSLVDVDLDDDLSTNTGSRDFERLAREFDRLLAASSEDLSSPEPPCTVELEVASLVGNEKCNSD